MAKKIRRESALNLTLEGTVGSFSVGTGQEGQNSIEVKYFLTHIGLDFSSSSNEALLSHLAPVREIFGLNDLDFDEIMQRDIDDARVSSELIPYLLDEQSVDLVKLFPPIVVVLLPVKEEENRPAKLYPEVQEEEKPETEEDDGTYILRSGSVGQEVFQLEQPISDGQRLKHDLVRFKLNTHKTRLVIVDGQHRAMALLALYRNLKDQWSDEKRAPFKEYYSQWTPQYIQKFNLKETNLPVILCTFPSLDKNYTGEFDLRKAARTVFLTLNRNARKVSRTRNILLDDNDIIAYFLRSCLFKIKQKDQRSSYSLRISNVELDQSDKERLKIESPIAITGVSHLYYIIEHLLLNSGDINGIKPRSGKFANRKDLNTYPFMQRLDGRNLLGLEIAESTKRDSFSIDVAEKLKEQFDQKYGNFITSILEQFVLYDNHSKAVLHLKQDISSYQDRQVEPILFHGQGISRVFNAHIENLKNKTKEGEYKNIPEIQSIIRTLSSTANRVEQAIESFHEKRAELCIDNITDKNQLKDTDSKKISSEVVKWFNNFYDHILTTVAFQSAIVCSFFGEIEKTNIKLEKNNEPVLSTDKTFEEYIEQLNNFFAPVSSSKFKKLVHIFTGEIKGEISNWQIKPTNETFRDIVFHGEMNPDNWTKYKYLILEIWHPSHEVLKNTVGEEREKCRGQIFSVLYNRNKSEYCKETSKFEDDLKNQEKDNIFNKTMTAYNSLLKNIDTLLQNIEIKLLDEQKMKTAFSFIPASEIDESDED